MIFSLFFSVRSPGFGVLYSPIGVEDRRCAMARFRPEDAADNRVVAEGEDGQLYGTTGLPVGLHLVTGKAKKLFGADELYAKGSRIQEFEGNIRNRRSFTVNRASSSK